MRLRRTIAAAATAVLAAVSVTACGSDPGSSDGGMIINVWGSEPQNPLVPTQNNETGGHDILKYLFDTLVTFQPDGSIENEVAESIEANEDNTEFTITLNDDRTFTDGTPVEAASFVDAWNYGAAAKNAQLQQSFFSSIEGYDEVSREGSEADEMSGLEVVSPTEFTVRLSAPEAEFPKRLGYTAYAPLPAVAFEDMEAFGESPIGNGPYMMAGPGAWEHEVGAELVANPDYVGSRTPENDGLSYKFYTSNDTAYADLQSGTLDTIGYTVPQSAFGTFMTDFPDSHSNEPYTNNYTFTIPNRLEHFGNDDEGRLRRQAISMAINRDQIVEKIFQNTRTPMTEFTTSALEGYNDSIPGSEVLQYNPDRAKQLWAEADAIQPFTGTFEIAYNADASHQVWIDAVSNDLKNTLGIQAQGKAYPTFAQLRTEVTERQIETPFRTGWIADYPSRVNFLQPLFETGAASNDGDYSNPEFDAQIDKINAANEEEEIKAATDEAQSILLRDLPAIPLWYGNASTAWNPELQGVEIDFDGYPIYHKITK